MSDTPISDRAEAKLEAWKKRSYAAGMRGSHLDSDDPRPPDGWEKARDLERAANALRDAAIFLDLNAMIGGDRRQMETARAQLKLKITAFDSLKKL